MHNLMSVPIKKIPVIRLESSKVLEQYFRLLHKLGEGTFGIVVSAVDIRDGSMWAVKKVVKNRKYRTLKKSWQKEFSILSKIQHPNIIYMKEMYETHNFAYFILEYCDGFNLAKRLKMHDKFSEPETSYVIHQLSAALAYVHRKQIVHRDVKLENIFLRYKQQDSTHKSSIFPLGSGGNEAKDSEKTQSSTINTSDEPSAIVSLMQFDVKLGDFGLAVELRKHEDTMIEFCGTPLYMAPEIVSGKSYSRQCDVWSIGIIMYMMLTGRPPFASHREANLFSEIRTLEVSKLCNSSISPGAKNCLSKLLHLDPGYRYSMLELMVDAWTGQNSKYNVSTNTFVDKIRPESVAGETIIKSKNVLELMKEYNTNTRSLLSSLTSGSVSQQQSTI